MYKLSVPSNVAGGIEKCFVTESDAWDWSSDELPPQIWEHVEVEWVPNPQVMVNVHMIFTPTEEEVTRASDSYESTRESPYPDPEWIQEAVAMNRLEQIAGVGDMTIVD